MTKLNIWNWEWGISRFWILDFGMRILKKGKPGYLQSLRQKQTATFFQPSTLSFQL